MIKFYYREWKEAEKDGNIKYALNCKEQYRILVMESRKESYNYIRDELKMFPIIHLN